MKKIGVFYGPAGGSTEDVAQQIVKALSNQNVTASPVKDVTSDTFLGYDNLILGVATVGKDTWDSDHPGNDWNEFLPKLPENALKGKIIAIFGLGNQITYPDDFVDDIGRLAMRLRELGATIIGNWPTDGYTFSSSQAIENGKFIGLPIDEDTQPELSNERINNWLKQVVETFN